MTGAEQYKHVESGQCWSVSVLGCRCWSPTFAIN